MGRAYSISSQVKLIHVHTQSLVTRIHRSGYIKQGGAIIDRPKHGAVEAHIIHTETTNAAIQRGVPFWGELYYTRPPVEQRQTHCWKH
jgi:hypothetical protein